MDIRPIRTLIVFLLFYIFAYSSYAITYEAVRSRTLTLARLSTFETKARVLRGLSYAFLNYQIKVFTTPLRMPFAPLPS